MHSYHPGRRGVRPASQRPRRPPIGISSALCKFYPGGNCNFGESCRFRHSTSPDKNSSAATNFAAPPARRFMRQQQQQEPAEGTPPAPSPSRQGVGGPSIPSGGRGRALKPNQLTSSGAAPATSNDVKASGSGKSFSGSDVAKKAKTKNKTSDKRSSASKLGGGGGNAKPSASRHPTSSVKKNRRSVTRNAAGGAGGGQPSVDAMSAASGQPNKKKNDKTKIPDDLNPPSDEVAQDDSPTDTTAGPVGVQPATDAAAVTDPSNSTTTKKKAIDGHDNVKDDDERAPHPPILHPKASEGRNAECEEETDDEWTYDVEEDMRRYWHEDITTTLIAHEELVAVQKRWENARALAKAKANSKEKMQDESNKSGKENDAQNDVPDATGGTDTAERDEKGKEEAARVHWDENTDGQGETGDKKSEVEYEASRYPVRPEKTRCRCFCPSELSRVTIYLPCPNFKACHLVFCPFQHMKKDFLDDRMAKRGKGVDDLVMGVHDETCHVPDHYDEGYDETRPTPPPVPLSTVDILCKISPPTSSPTPPTSDTVMLCQFIGSKDSADEDGDLLDPYYYDDDGNIQFYGPSGIPNDPRTREELHWEDPEAYSRESIERSWNYVPKPASHWSTEKCDLGKACRRYGCRYMHNGTSDSLESYVDDDAREEQDDTKLSGDGEGGAPEATDGEHVTNNDSKTLMGNISAPATTKEDNGEVDANNGVDVVDSHRKTTYKKKSGRSYHKLGKGEKKPKGGRKAKKKPFKTATRNQLKQQQPKSGAALNPSAIEFVPFSCTLISEAVIEGEPRGEAHCTKAKIEGDQEPSAYNTADTTCSKSFDSTDVPISSAPKLTAANGPDWIDAQAINQRRAKDEMMSRKPADATATDRSNKAAASPVKPYTETYSRDRSGAFDLSNDVSPPAPAWSTPSRFRGTDKEVMVALRKSEQDLSDETSDCVNFLEASKNKPKKLVHPESALSTPPGTPGILNDRNEEESTGTIPSKPGSRQYKMSKRKQSKASTNQVNAVGTATAKVSRQTSSESRTKSKTKTNVVSIKNDTEVSATAATATGVSSKPLFDPRNLSSNIGLLPARPKSVNACVSKMREMGFSESIVSLTQEEFKARKPGTWTKEDLFAFACHFAEEEDAKTFASDQHSVDEDETKSNVRPGSRPKFEAAVEETKGIDPEDCPETATSDKKKEATKRKKGAKKKKKKTEKASEEEDIIPSVPSAQPSQGGQVSQEKTGQNEPRKDEEYLLKQPSETLSPSEVSESGAVCTDPSSTKRSPEAKERFGFWAGEQLHRDLYTENLLRLVLYEYARLRHCDDPQEVTTNTALVETFRKGCTKAYDHLYNYRTSNKSTVIVASHHFSALVGRSGKIVGSNSSRHEFEIEFLPNKHEKMAKTTAAASRATSSARDDFADLVNETSPSTRMMISVYDLALPEAADFKGKGKKGGKKGKKNRSAAQAARLIQYTIDIDEDVENDIHGFSIAVKASTLNELAGIKDSAKFEQRLEEIMRERDQDEDDARALKEEEEQAKIREAEEKEKRETAQRFQQYEKEINSRRKKARRVLAAGSKFVEGLKSKPDDPLQDLYNDADSLQGHIQNRFIDLLVILHECEDDQDATEMAEAIVECGLNPNAVEFGEFGEKTRTVVFFEHDEKKVPVAIFDRKLLLSGHDDEDPAWDGYDELCRHIPGLSKRNACNLILAMIVHRQECSKTSRPSAGQKCDDPAFDAPLVRCLIKCDLLEKDFVQHLLSRERTNFDWDRIICAIVTRQLQERFNFSLDDVLKNCVEVDGDEESDSEFEGDRDEELASDDEDCSTFRWESHLNQVIDQDRLKELCSVTDMTEDEAICFFVHLISSHFGEPSSIPREVVMKLIVSGLVEAKIWFGCSKTRSDILYDLVDQRLKYRFNFSLCDVIDVRRLLLQVDHGSEECASHLDEEDKCFIEELSSTDDDEATRADETQTSEGDGKADEDEDEGSNDNERSDDDEESNDEEFV